MKSINPVLPLMFLALGAVSMPLPLDVACGMIPHPDSDPCRDSPLDPCAEPAREGDTPPTDERRCETGCQHCSLPCCAGTAMIQPLPVLEQTPTAHGRLAAVSVASPRFAADLLEHPPRN